MKQIFISPANKTIEVPEKVWDELSIRKIFWPPHTNIRLGKSKWVKLQDIELQPPPKQEKLL